MRHKLAGEAEGRLSVVGCMGFVPVAAQQQRETFSRVFEIVHNQNAQAPVRS
jgi:hypothetical protein